MKKILSVVAVVMCWMACVLPVKADLIWEPYEDDFYMEYREEMDYINRVYIADGPDGKVIAYESPENPAVVTTWENGFSARIYHIWTDENGVRWGLYNDWETDETAWVPMEYMDVEYDYLCFEEEFGDSFVEETVAIPGEYVKQTSYWWSYPGAEDCMEVVLPEYEADMPQCHKTFVDENGQKWGYIGYFRGIRNKWVCLDNPVADAATLYPNGLPARGTNMVDETTFSGDEKRIVPGGESGGSLGLIICLVLGVCGATGGALVGMKKKRA